MACVCFSGLRPLVWSGMKPNPNALPLSRHCSYTLPLKVIYCLIVFIYHIHHIAFDTFFHSLHLLVGNKPYLQHHVCVRLGFELLSRLFQLPFLQYKNAHLDFHILLLLILLCIFRYPFYYKFSVNIRPTHTCGMLAVIA